MSYYGWIPILSGDISLEIIKKDPFSTGYYDDKTVFTDYLQPIYCTRRTYYDTNNKATKIEINIPERCILQVNIEELDSKGLVKFSYTTDLSIPSKMLDERYAQIAYNSIKDFYHLHIHHDKEDDYILRPVVAGDQKEAIQKILNQYREKIILYHKEISNVVQGTILKRNLPPLISRIIKDMIRIAEYVFGIQQINIALGEFTYASSFINYYTGDIEKNDSVKELFSNATESLKIIRERIAWRLGFFVAFVALFIAVLSLLIGVLKII